MTEIWKDIPGYEGLYQASNCGNIRSLNWGRRNIVRNLYLKPHNKGYLQVELAKDGSKKMTTVHRLVAMTFIPNPNNLPIINHKDENKHNNNVNNLEWCTFSYNNSYSKELHKERIGKPRKNYKKVIQFDLNGEKIKIWDCLVDIKHTNGMNEWSIRQCCEGNRKTAYGFRWQYAI